MDPKIHPLTTVVKLIKQVYPADSGTFCLYAENQDIHIARCSLVPKDAPIIARLSPLDIDVGIGTAKWSAIEAQIRIFRKKGILEWHHPKP